MHGQIGAYDEATAIAQTTGQPADIAAVRSFHTKFGVALNLQQQVAADIGLFARMSAAQGKYEAFEFTDVNRSVALGLSINGSRWQRADDRFGLGAAFNHASSAAERFFDAGGLGILVGDGQLPHPGSERILETYYSFFIVRGVRLSLDYQFIDNPAYNRDRGPVSVFGVRVHGQI
jgi:high affinity Mn2+ porin